jgi:hypothetical protein
MNLLQNPTFVDDILGLALSGSFSSIATGLYSRRSVGIPHLEAWFATPLDAPTACGVLADLDTDAAIEHLKAHVVADAQLEVSAVRLVAETVEHDATLLDLAPIAQVVCEVHWMTTDRRMSAVDWRCPGQVGP